MQLYKFKYTYTDLENNIIISGFVAAGSFASAHILATNMALTNFTSNHSHELFNLKFLTISNEKIPFAKD